jgi:glycerol-3-phosphate dehydrogenase
MTAVAPRPTGRTRGRRTTASLTTGAEAVPEALRRRARDLGRLADTTWDVLIVGGGIVGMGALLDAVSRGLRAAVIDQDDVAAGTSSRSSRLIHGGVRYLEQLHLPLVREALAERRRLLRNAPHLVTLQPLLFPIFGLPFMHKPFYDAGLTLYDILGARHDGGWHRRLSTAETLDIAPDLRKRDLRGGLLYHDGMEDDARLTLGVARTALASDLEPVAVTRVKALGLGDDVDESPSVRARVLRAQDLMSGSAFDIRARSVVDATGVWAADREHPFASAALRILPSRGAHLVVPRSRVPASTGLALRVPGKVVFFVPWPDFWLIGTTDAPYNGRTVRPGAGGWEVDQLLATTNHFFDIDLRRDDVVGTYAGLRPLIAPSGGSTVKASREHRVTVDGNRVVRIGGGKYTTYRVMAKDVIDGALGATEARRRPSDTEDRRIIGAADRPALDQIAAELAARPEIAAAHPEAARRLVARHGTEATAVAALGGELDLLRPLVAGRPFLEAEVAWGVRHELALTVDDILSRRLRLSPELGDGSVAAAAALRVAEIMGHELAWSDDRRRQEAATYLEGAALEYAVPPPA